MIKRWWRRLLKVVLWGVAALVCLEVLCFLIVVLSTYYLYGQFWEGEAVRYDPYALYLTGAGVRPTANNPASPDPNTHRHIWMMGGSTVRGVTDFDERTIPSYLARMLNQEEPRLPAVVWNFGVDGFNSLMEAKYLQKLLIEKQPSPAAIIFYDGANDCTYFAQYRTPDAHHGYRQVRALIESYHGSFFGLLKPLNAALYASYTRDFYDKVRQGVIPIEEGDRVLAEFVQSAVRRYDYLHRLAEGFGARFLLVWQPMWWVEDGRVDEGVKKQEKEYMIIGKHFSLIHNFRVTYRALSGELRRKPYFVDFQNILCTRTEPTYQSDGIHLTDAGRELVARHLARRLRQERRP